MRINIPVHSQKPDEGVHLQARSAEIAYFSTKQIFNILAPA